jgi:hypothetical protein
MSLRRLGSALPRLTAQLWSVERAATIPLTVRLDRLGAVALHSSATTMARGEPFDPMLPFSPRSTPSNTVLRIVPQQTAYVVERFGRFHRILTPGLHVLIPVVDRIAYAHSLKETTIPVPNQTAITKDNVSLTIDGVRNGIMSGSRQSLTC